MAPQMPQVEAKGPASVLLSIDQSLTTGQPPGGGLNLSEGCSSPRREAIPREGRSSENI